MIFVGHIPNEKKSGEIFMIRHLLRNIRIPMKRAALREIPALLPWNK